MPALRTDARWQEIVKRPETTGKIQAGTKRYSGFCTAIAQLRTTTHDKEPLHVQQARQPVPTPRQRGQWIARPGTDRRLPNRSCRQPGGSQSLVAGHRLHTEDAHPATNASAALKNADAGWTAGSDGAQGNRLSTVNSAAA